jgi:hypothetical protein
MKKILSAIAVLFWVIILPKITTAQNSINTEILNRKKEFAEIFKAPIAPTSHENLTLIKPKAVRHFFNNYSTAKNERWSIISDGFKVNFIQDGVINAVYYDSKGNWNGIFKKFPEEKLPLVVKDLVKRYDDNTFIYAMSIETFQSDQEPTYAVYFEDEKSLKCLKIFNGEMELEKELFKQQ